MSVIFNQWISTSVARLAALDRATSCVMCECGVCIPKASEFHIHTYLHNIKPLVVYSVQFVVLLHFLHTQTISLWRILV